MLPQVPRAALPVTGIAAGVICTEKPSPRNTIEPKARAFFVFGRGWPALNSKLRPKLHMLVTTHEDKPPLSMERMSECAKQPGIMMRSRSVQ